MRNSSPPDALHATTSQGADTRCAIDKDFMVPTQIAVEMDVHFLALPAAMSPAVAPLGITVQGSDVEFSYFANDTGSVFQVTGHDNTTVYSEEYSDTVASPGINGYRHLKLVVVANAKGATMDGFVDGTEARHGGISGAQSTKRPLPPGSTVRVHVGIAYLYQQPSGDVLVDNVVVTVK